MQRNKERYLINKSTISSNTTLNWKRCFQNRRLNLTFSLKNVHSPRPQPNNFSHHRSQWFITRCIKAQQGFYNVLIQITFTLSSNFKAFLSNLAEMFIGWSYTRFLFLALIGNPTRLPGPIMCSDWLKF